MLSKAAKTSYSFLRTYKLASNRLLRLKPLHFLDFLEKPPGSLYEIPLQRFCSKNDDSQPKESQSKESQSNTGDNKSPAIPSPKSKILSDTSSFKSRIEAGAIVVDKTDLLFNLIEEGNSAFVIGPRRSGKTLNLSTMEAIFSEGKDWWKTYCQELKIIKDHKYDFPQHPVLRLDFSGKLTLLDLKEHIYYRLNSLVYNVKKSKRIKDPDLLADIRKALNNFEPEMVNIRLAYVIETIYNATEKGVVVLIDEYDRPITDLIAKIERTSGIGKKSRDYSKDPEVQASMEFLKQFLETIKSLRGCGFVHIQYVTGIVPLSQVGLFSGPNDIYQVRRNPLYNYLIGYTEDEIYKYFGSIISEMAEKLLKNRQEQGVKNYKAQTKDDVEKEMKSNLKENYNGFVFHNRQEKPLYSSFCINTFFEKNREILDTQVDLLYDPYFAESGSTKLIWNAVRKMTIQEQLKLLWAFENSIFSNDEILFSKQSSSKFKENQTPNQLFDNPERLGFFSGMLKVVKEKSTDTSWNLAIVNNEMRKTLLNEIEAAAELDESKAYFLLESLKIGNYGKYWESISEMMKKISIFLDSRENLGKHELEVEAYGTTHFSFINNALKKVNIESKVLEDFKLEFNKKIGESSNQNIGESSNQNIGESSNNRPDAVISFSIITNPQTMMTHKSTAESGTNEKNDNSKKKSVALIIEFKCKTTIEKAIREAEKSLKERYTDVIESKFEEVIYVAGALSSGKIKKVKWYKWNKGLKELAEIGEWPLIKK